MVWLNFDFCNGKIFIRVFSGRIVAVIIVDTAVKAKQTIHDDDEINKRSNRSILNSIHTMQSDDLLKW